MAVVGETVKMNVIIGRDEFEEPIFEVTELQNCVIVPKGTANGIVNGYFLASENISLLAAGFIPQPIEKDTVFTIRGVDYVLDGVPFDHRSMFGTGAGGTEIPLKLERVGG